MQESTGGLMDFKTYSETALNWFLASGIKILIIIILAFIALRFAKRLSLKLFLMFRRDKEDIEFKKNVDTLSSLLHYLLATVIVGVAIVMILDEFKIEIGPILAAAGIVGIAIGFGAQYLVQDIISGFFILIENQVRVGDVIQAAGKAGQVEKVNLKMIVLRDFAGNVHYIRNGMIDVVTNMTKDYSRYVFEIGVAYREDVDEVFEIIREVDEDLRKDEKYKNYILEPIEVMGLDKFDDSALIIKARTKTVPIKQWSVAREFNRRMKKAFDERGIEIPFPHRTIYMGQDKKGDSPPVNVNMKNSND